MTLNDLNKEVAALGFESTVELDEAFLYCANRALLTVFTERPLKKTVRLPVIKAPCLSYTECIVHHSGDVITLPLGCTCASFRVSGKGSFTLVGDYERRTEFDTPDSLFRIFCEDFREIRFEGAYYFTVHSLALYSERFGEGEDTIPEYSTEITVDVKERCGDFLSFCDTPKGADGKDIEFLRMQDGKIILPRDTEDKITLTYARLPRKIRAEDVDTPIDVSAECEALLPLLVASYLWLDDDSAKAQYYMDVYRTEMSFIRRYNTQAQECAYRDTTGWA